MCKSQSNAKMSGKNWKNLDFFTRTTFDFRDIELKIHRFSEI